MGGDVSANLRRLQEHVGSGKIGARVTIDQAYAQDQHETMFYKHPKGGGPKFLEGPLFENHGKYYSTVADHILQPDGPSMATVFLGVGRKLRDDSRQRTPREFGSLRLSGAVDVVENGSVVEHEPSAQHRLSEEELHALDQLRGDGRGDW